MQQRSWIRAVLVLSAASVFAAEPRSPSGLPVPPKPRDLRAASGMPNVLPRPAFNQVAPPVAPSGSAKSPDTDDPRANAVREKNPIPDGYIRAQASADWRGQSAAWYREQAQKIVDKVKNAQPQAQVAGVSIVDQATGDILQLIGAGELTGATTDDPKPAN